MKRPKLRPEFWTTNESYVAAVAAVTSAASGWTGLTDLAHTLVEAERRYVEERAKAASAVGRSAACALRNRDVPLAHDLVCEAYKIESEFGNPTTWGPALKAVYGLLCTLDDLRLPEVVKVTGCTFEPEAFSTLKQSGPATLATAANVSSDNAERLSWAADGSPVIAKIKVGKRFKLVKCQVAHIRCGTEQFTALVLAQPARPLGQVA